MKIPLQIMIVMAYGASSTLAEPAVSLTGRKFVCKGATAIFTCVTTTIPGLLIWRTNTSNEEIKFSNSPTGNSYKLGNITFRLNKISNITKGHQQYLQYNSTAVVTRVMEDIRIECGYDGNSFLNRKVNILSVPRPSWRFWPCTFNLHRVMLSWNRPQCCTKYVLQEFKLFTSDTCMARNYGKVINESIVDEPRYTLPLNEGSYRVQCLNKYGYRGPFSIPLDIKLETPIESMYVALSKVEGDCAEYLVAWREQKHTTRYAKRIVCIPSVNSANATVVCSSMSGSYKTRHNQDRISNCYVPRNENFTAMVDLVNTAGFRSNESTSTDISVSIYQELQEEVEKREKITQDLNNCLTNLANLTNSSSTCPPYDNNSGLFALIGSTIGLILIAIILGIACLVYIIYYFYKNPK